MGSKSSPQIADIVMHWLELQILNEYRERIAFWRRYQDDILFVWTGTTEQLKGMETELNKMHALLKF